MDTHVNSEEENISEVVGACAAHGNFKRRKLITKSTSTIESLPDEVVFDILARVPALDIHSAARLVCHKWYQTIRTHDFVRAHLQQSTRGLVIQRAGSERDSKFATHQKGRMMMISDFIYKKFPRDVFSSCNGLVLECREIEKTEWVIRITNPATNQHMDLPSFGGKAFCSCAIAYAVASKEYKVVSSFVSHSGRVECAIFTVGVDEDWKRRVDIQHLSPTSKYMVFKQIPLSTDGFVHWTARCGRGRNSEKVVMTLNIETEIITQFPSVPRNLLCDGGETKLLYRYLPMGSCLSLLIARGNEPFPIWDQVWVMKPETGEWTKMMSIYSESLMRALQGVSPLFHIFYPVAWLKFREVLVFNSLNQSSRTRICIAYNVRTHEIGSSSFELGFFPHRFIVHTNSLIWLD